MPIDLNSPIIPCGGAGLIILGYPVEIVVPNAGEDFISEPLVVGDERHKDAKRYRSAYVDFWTDNEGIVTQVMVHDGYTGKLLGKIGLGSLMSDVEQFLGTIAIIDENLVVKGLPGISFEPKMDQPDSPIIEIYVWKPDWGEIYSHQIPNTLTPFNPNSYPSST